MIEEYILLGLLAMVVIGTISIIIHAKITQGNNHQIVEQKRKLLETEAKYRRYEKELKD